MPSTEGLLSAMLAVQGEAPTMPKDRTVKVQTKNGGEYSYSYTPLDTIVEKVGPLLYKNGLVWSTLPGRDAHGDPALRYRLAHAATGEVLEGEMPLMLADQDAQSMGSAITYMRRYALCAVLNIVADADDDGALATANGGAGASSGRGGPASGKQIALVRSLMTKAGVKQGEAVKLLATVGVTVAEGESARDACARLRWPGVSDLIDTLKNGPIPSGDSDVPSDASGYAHPPEQDPLPVA